MGCAGCKQKHRQRIIISEHGKENTDENGNPIPESEVNLYTIREVSPYFEESMVNSNLNSANPLLLKSSKDFNIPLNPIA